MKFPQTGTLTIYRGKTAVVKEINSDKITIAIVGGDSKSVRLKDIEPIHPGPVKSPEISPAAPPEWDEVLALMLDEILPWEDFVEIAWGAFSPEAAYAAWLTLNENLYITGTVADGIQARPADEIAAVLQQQAEKSNRKEARNALLERIRSGAILPEDRSSLVEVELVARNQRETSALLKDLEIECTPEQAHRLLLRLGVWDEMVNPWPERFGIDRAAPEFALGGLPEESRVDLTHLRALAIDNAGSEDPDDAIGWDAESGCLWVHVADPAALIAAESEADLEARVRGCNLYLPEGVVPMLPEAATLRLGLGLLEKSPAISLKIRIDATGEAHLETFFPSWVNVERHTYESVEDTLETDALFAPMLPMFEAFNARRRRLGGSELNFPEFDVKVRDGEVQLIEVKPLRSRKLVETAMLAAGSAVASWAVANDVAMPFVSQSYSEDAPAFVGEPDSWIESFRRRQFFRPSQVSSSALLHAGLGLEAYVRVTSPLRRYTDLLVHRQLRAHFLHRQLMDAETIDRILTYSENGAQMRRQAERRSEDYWRMVWFKHHPEWSGEAVLLGVIREKAVYLLPELGYEYRARYGVEAAPGTVLCARPGRIDLAGEFCQLLFG